MYGYIKISSLTLLYSRYHETKIIFIQAKIKQHKQAQPQNSESFPEAPKISLTIEPQPKKQVNNILHELSTFVPESQLKQIQQQNRRIIQQMSKQQISKYQQMLFEQMPKSFLKKLIKSQSKREQMNEEIPSKINEQKQNNIQNENDAQEENNVQTYRKEVDEEYLKQISIQITSGSIIPFQQYKQNHITIDELKLMLESENNQTQVIGCQILNKTLQKLVIKDYNNNYHLNKLFNLKHNYNLHRYVLIENICSYTLPSLLKNIIKNKFKSCWVEFILGLCSIINLCANYLSTQFIDKFNKVLEKTEKVEMEDIQNIKSKIKQTKNYLNKKLQIQIKEWQQSAFKQISNQQFSMTQIIQVIFLEQIYTKQCVFIRYLDSLPLKLNKMTKDNKINYIYTLVYHLNIKKLKQFSNIHIHLNILASIIKVFPQSNIDIINNQLILFKYLYCIKNLSATKFQQLVNLFNQNVDPNESILSILCYLNLESYSAGKLSLTQLNNLKLMMSYILKLIDKNILSIELIIYDILYIFENQYSPYNDLPQLDNFLSILIRKCNIKQLMKIIKIQKVKQLSKKYNFSSFGNASFTKFMLFLTVINTDIQCLIVEQVMGRYPFLFYYVVQDYGIYQNNDITYNNNNLKNQKKDIKQILEHDPQCNKNNLYYKYLCGDNN